MDFTDDELRVVYAALLALVDNSVDDVIRDLSAQQRRTLTILLRRMDEEFPEGYRDFNS